MKSNMKREFVEGGDQQIYLGYIRVKRADCIFFSMLFEYGTDWGTEVLSGDIRRTH